MCIAVEVIVCRRVVVLRHAILRITTGVVMRSSCAWLVRTCNVNRDRVDCSGTSATNVHLQRSGAKLQTGPLRSKGWGVLQNRGLQVYVASHRHLRVLRLRQRVRLRRLGKAAVWGGVRCHPMTVRSSADASGLCDAVQRRRAQVQNAATGRIYVRLQQLSLYAAILQHASVPSKKWEHQSKFGSESQLAFRELRTGAYSDQLRRLPC